MMRILAILAFLAGACSARKYTKGEELRVEDTPLSFIEAERITAGLESSFNPSVSKNGAYVFFTSDRFGNKDVFEKKTGGGFPRPITVHPADDYAPVLSPDGKYIAFISRRDDATGDIYIAETGSTITTVLGAKEPSFDHVDLPASEEISPTWFPDSKTLVFVSRSEGGRKKTLMTVTRGALKPKPLADVDADQPNVSPDGKLVVFSKQGSLFLLDVESSKEHRLTSPLSFIDGLPHFSQDGKSIIFVRYAEDTNLDGRISAQDNPAIWRLNLEEPSKEQAGYGAGSAYPLTRARLAYFSPEPSENYLYMTRPSSGSLDIFRLPLSGELNSRLKLADIAKLVNESGVDTDSVFLLRTAQSKALSAANKDLYYQLVFQEADTLVAGNRYLELRDMLNAAKAVGAENKDFLAALDAVDLGMQIDKIWQQALTRPLTRAEKDVLSKLERSLNTSVARKNAGFADTFREYLSISQIKLAWCKESWVDLATQFNSYFEAVKPEESINVVMLQIQNLLRQGLKDKAKARFVEVANTQSLPNRSTAQLTAALLVLLEPGDAGVDDIRQVQSQLYPKSYGSYLLQKELVARYSASQKNSTAMAELQRMIADYPKDAATAFDLSDRYERDGRHDDAEDTLKRFAKLSADSVEGKERLFAFLLRKAQRYWAAKEFRLADAVYKTILKQDPQQYAAKKGSLNAAAREGKLLNEEKAAMADLDRSPNDAFLLYSLGLIKLMQASQAETLGARATVVDGAITLLERARARKGQVAEIHEALGNAYQDRGRIADKLNAKRSIEHATSRSLKMVKDFFGFSDPAWHEQAVDSYLVAYHLHDTPDIDGRVELTERLAEGFFDLKVYSKALYYDLRRIQQLSVVPAASLSAEANLYLNAAKAAFQMEDIAMSETLNRKELELWESVGNQVGIARSLDRLALSLREKKDYRGAADTYRRLIPVQERLGDHRNLTLSYLNLATVLVETGEYTAALDQLNKSEKRLFKRTTPSKGGTDLASDDQDDDDKIKIDLAAGQSDAKGFDDLTRYILLLSLRVRCYVAQARPLDAIADQKTKLSLLEKKRSLGRSQGAPSTFYTEEIASAHSQLAKMYFQEGQFSDAIDSFRKTAELLVDLRPKGRKYPAKPELTAMLSYLNIYEYLAALDLLSKAEDKAYKADVAALANALEKARKDGDQSLNDSLAKLLAMQSGYASNAQATEIFKAWAALGDAGFGDAKNTSLLALNDPNLFLPPKDPKSLKEKRSLRDLAMLDPVFGWKFFALKGAWDLALTNGIVAAYQGSGFSQRKDGPYLDVVFSAWLRTFTNTDDSVVPVDQAFAFLHAKAYALMAETASDNSLGQRLRDAKERTIDDVFKQLRPDDAFLVLHKDRSNGVFAIFGQQQKQSVKYFADAAALKSFLSTTFASYKHTYLVPSGAWSLPVLADVMQNIGKDGCYSLIASPLLLKEYRSTQKVAKASVLRYPVASDTSSVIKDANAIRYYKAMTGRPQSKDFGDFDLVQIDLPLFLNDFSTRYSYFEQLSKKRRPVQVGLNELFTQKLAQTSAMIFSRVVAWTDKAHPYQDDVSSALALSLAALDAGVPSLVIPRQVEIKANDAAKFYQYLEQMSLADALKKSGADAVLLGYPGANYSAELAFGESQMQDFVDDMQRRRHSDDADALIKYRRAYYYAGKLGRTDQRNRALSKIIENLYRDRDFKSALSLQEQNLKDRAADPSAQRLEDALFTANLALAAGDYAKAAVWLRRAEDLGGTASPKVAILKGKLFLAQNDLKAAEAAFNDSLALSQANDAEHTEAVFLLSSMTRANPASLPLSNKYLKDAYDNYGSVAGTDVGLAILTAYLEEALYHERRQDAVQAFQLLVSSYADRVTSELPTLALTLAAARQLGNPLPEPAKDAPMTRQALYRLYNDVTRANQVGDPALTAEYPLVVFSEEIRPAIAEAVNGLKTDAEAFDALAATSTPALQPKEYSFLKYLLLEKAKSTDSVRFKNTLADICAQLDAYPLYAKSCFLDLAELAGRTGDSDLAKVNTDRARAISAEGWRISLLQQRFLAPKDSALARANMAAFVARKNDLKTLTALSAAFSPDELCRSFALSWERNDTVTVSHDDYMAYSQCLFVTHTDLDDDASRPPRPLADDEVSIAYILFEDRVAAVLSDGRKTQVVSTPAAIADIKRQQSMYMTAVRANIEPQESELALLAAFVDPLRDKLQGIGHIWIVDNGELGVPVEALGSKQRRSLHDLARVVYTRQSAFYTDDMNTDRLTTAAFRVNADEQSFLAQKSSYLLDRYFSPAKESKAALLVVSKDVGLSKSFRPKLLQSFSPSEGLRGAASLSPLWPVTDLQALSFSREFYEQLAKSKGLSHAFQAAKNRMRDLFPTSYGWMAWRLVEE